MDLEEELYEDSTEELPIVLEDPKAQVYLPVATTQTKGIASFDAKDFNVDPKGKVALNEDLHQIKENSDSALENSQEAKETADSAKEAAEEALEQIVEGLGSKVYVNGVLQSTVNVDGDIQEQFDQLTEEVEGIQELVPNQASAQNQLADKNFVNSSINAIAAFYITYDSQGNPFPTKAALSSATTFYSGGETRVPTRNDYSLVLADETHDNASCRYVYSGEYPNGQWDFQFIVNETPFTSEQLAAINSGITSNLVQQIPNKLDKTTGNNVVYTNNGQGEPSSLTYSQASNISNAIVQRKASGAVAVPTPSANEDAVPKSYIDSLLNPTPVYPQEPADSNFEADIEYIQFGKIVLVKVADLRVRGSFTHGDLIASGFPSPTVDNTIFVLAGAKSNEGSSIRVRIRDGNLEIHYDEESGDTGYDKSYCGVFWYLTR